MLVTLLLVRGRWAPPDLFLNNQLTKPNNCREYRITNYFITWKYYSQPSCRNPFLSMYAKQCYLYLLLSAYLVLKHSRSIASWKSIKCNGTQLYVFQQLQHAIHKRLKISIKGCLFTFLDAS